MLATKNIEQAIDEGRHEEAHKALDHLLSLGPKNTTALKLRAQLHESEGRLLDAEKVWTDVLRIDDEDIEAQEAFLQRHVDEREHFYFTDELPDGGRRYLAYPREVIHRSLLGLLGCVLFLLQVKLSYRWPILAEGRWLVPTFSLFIVAPWIAIIHGYFTGLHSVSLTRLGLNVRSRLRSWNCGWKDLAGVYMVRGRPEESRALTMVLVPVGNEAEAVEIDMSAETTPIRGRSVFFREMLRFVPEVRHITKESLIVGNRRVSRY